MSGQPEDAAPPAIDANDPANWVLHISHHDEDGVDRLAAVLLISGVWMADYPLLRRVVDDFSGHGCPKAVFMAAIAKLLLAASANPAVAKASKDHALLTAVPAGNA